MEVGAHVWLRSSSSRWGWVPAKIVEKEETTTAKHASGKNAAMVKLTLRDDCRREAVGEFSGSMNSKNSNCEGISDYFADVQPFETTVVVDPNTLKNADHNDIKLRNLPTSYQLCGRDTEAGVIASPSTMVDSSVVGGVHDLIGLTHLHEPAILHALRLRYDADIIYTSTGPILIAVNPFKKMDLYSDDIMETYRRQGENSMGAKNNTNRMLHATPFKASMNRRHRNYDDDDKLPPHAYKTADDAYRAMMRGLENSVLMNNKGGKRHSTAVIADAPTNQSILVSGESGAGKTVTTKIVLNYFAMLSKKIACDEHARKKSSFSPIRAYSPRTQYSSPMAHQRRPHSPQATDDEEVCIEQQVLQSNPILEAFGNARTLRNDNSSRFGKYIDIQFTHRGKLAGAIVETYLLEKVRLIHPGKGERNYHVFYQFLQSATPEERKKFYLGSKSVEDFVLLSQTGTYSRRDGVLDRDMHEEMLDAMVSFR